MVFFLKKNILIPNVAGKNIQILVEEKNNNRNQFLSYNLILNSGNFFSSFSLQKKYSNSCVVRKKIP